MTPASALKKAGVLRSVLKACAVVLVVLIAVEAVRYLGARGPVLPDELASDPRQAALEREGVPDVKDYAAIVEEEHFGKKPPPPGLQLFGILGDSALIGESPEKANLQKVDDKLPGERVLVEVGADYAVVEQQGQRQTLKLFGEPICQPESKAGPADVNKAQGNQPQAPKKPDGTPAAGEGVRSDEHRS
jgi:hypothetical protein